jgi:DNA polymerase elongation subunit (family B)
MSKIMTVSEIEDSDEDIDVGETKIVGFEYKRSDIADLTKQVQKRILNHIVNGDSDESIREAVFQAAQRITRTEPDWDAIGIPGGIGQELDEYDSDTAQVRAAKASNQLLGMSIGKGDKPKRVYLEEKNIENNGESLRTDVIAFTDSTDIAPLTDQLYVDVGKMRDTLIRQPIGRILTPIGIDVDAAMTGRVQQAISDWV